MLTSDNYLKMKYVIIDAIINKLIMDILQLRVKKLTENAILPRRANMYDAGMDLSYSRDEPLVVEPGKRVCVPIDISVQLSELSDLRMIPDGVKTANFSVPSNHYLRIAPRSGLALKHGIDVGAGVVDYGYTGPLGVVVFNFGDAPFTINKGDRIAQMIAERISYAYVKEVEQLDETTRGNEGFGSSGK